MPVTVQNRKADPASTQAFKVVCRMCHGGCGTIVHMEDGRVTEVVGDLDHPINKGKLCSKAGQPSVEQLYHPDRLDYPLMRVGPRGSGKWRRASWDEALGFVAAEMQRIKGETGAESVAFARGMGLNNTNIIGRL